MNLLQEHAGNRFLHQTARIAVTSSENVWSTKIKELQKAMMLLEDAAEWLEAFMKEYIGFRKQRVFEMVRIEKGMKLMGMTTRMEHKITDGVFDKFKARLCAMGNQQVALHSF